MKKAALLMHNPLNVTGGMERFNFYLHEFLKEEGYEVAAFDHTGTRPAGWEKRYWNPHIVYKHIGAGLNPADYEIVITVGFAGGAVTGPNVINVSFGSVESYLKSIGAWSPRRFRLFWEMFWCCRFDRRSKENQKVLATSKQVHEEIKKDYHLESTVVPCGIDTSHFSPRPELRHSAREQWGIPQQAQVGAFIGRWAPEHKGLDRLIPLMESRRDVFWLIATDGNPELPRVASKKVLSHVPYSQLPSFYAACDFTIQLSRYESFGLSFLESLCCGIPAISTPVGITPEVYTNAPLSDLLVTDPGREKVSRILDQVLDPDKHAGYALEAMKRTREFYSLTSWKQRMRQFLQTVKGKTP